MTITEETFQEIQEKPSESLYDVVRIPVNHISAIWSYVFPLLDQSREINPRLTMDQIIEGLADESLQLWVAVKNGGCAELVAAFLTAIERDQGQWVLSLHNLVGQEARGWVMVCHEEAHRFARLHECSRVRLCGRRAWTRILPPGYQVTGEVDGHFIYERPVD